MGATAPLPGCGVAQGNRCLGLRLGGQLHWDTTFHIGGGPTWSCLPCSTSAWPPPSQISFGGPGGPERSLRNSNHHVRHATEAHNTPTCTSVCVCGWHWLRNRAKRNLTPAPQRRPVKTEACAESTTESTAQCHIARRTTVRSWTTAASNKNACRTEPIAGHRSPRPRNCATARRTIGQTRSCRIPSRPAPPIPQQPDLEPTLAQTRTTSAQFRRTAAQSWSTTGRQSCLNSDEFGPNSVQVGPDAVNLFRFRDRSGQIRPSSARLQPTCGRYRPIPSKCWPRSADVAPHLALNALNPAKVGPNLTASGPTLADICRTPPGIGEMGPNSVNFGRHGSNSPHIGEIWPSSVDFGANLAQIGRTWSEFDQVRMEFAPNCGPESAKSGPSSMRNAVQSYCRWC